MPKPSLGGAKAPTWITLVLLVGTNVFLCVQLNRSHDLREKVEDQLVTAESSLEYALKESLKQGGLTPANSEDTFSVVVILDERGCAACILSELSALNAYWESLEQNTRVYYCGKRGKYLEEREIRFEYSRLTSTAKIFGENLGPINPVSVLMVGGQILDVRVSTPTNMYHEEIASAWYAGVGLLL